MTWLERKAARKEHYEKSIKGWKLVPCGACSGPGFYDGGDPHNHPCGCCEGTGKERVSPKEYETYMITTRALHKAVEGVRNGTVR